MTYTLKELVANGGDPERIEFRRMRKAKGLTQRQVGELAGVGVYPVMDYEHSRYVRPERVAAITAALQAAPPHRDYAVRMAEYRERLGVTMSEAARRAGVSPNMWMLAESRGRYSVSPSPNVKAALDAAFARWDAELAAVEPPKVKRPSARFHPPLPEAAE